MRSNLSILFNEVMLLYVGIGKTKKMGCIVPSFYTSCPSRVHRIDFHPPCPEKKKKCCLNFDVLALSSVSCTTSQENRPAPYIVQIQHRPLRMEHQTSDLKRKFTHNNFPSGVCRAPRPLPIHNANMLLPLRDQSSASIFTSLILIGGAVL